MGGSYKSETRHAFSLVCHRFFFLERGQSGAVYGDGLITQKGTLLQVLEEAPARLRLPAYLDAIAPDAFETCKEITVIGHHIRQVKSWKPLLKAKKCMLYLECEKASRFCTICLYFSSVEGFDDAFPSDNFIDFDAYDRRFARVRDQECKLFMALARILYPYQLSEKARSDYEALLKKRSFPAQTLLVSGIFDRYGQLPERWQEVMNLKKPEKYIARELVRMASENGQNRWVGVLLSDLKSGQAQKKGSNSVTVYSANPSEINDAVYSANPSEADDSRHSANRSEADDSRHSANVSKMNDANDSTNVSDFLFQKSAALFTTRCPELSGCLAARYEKISSLFAESLDSADTDPVRLLSHILFHELFGMWGAVKQRIVPFANEKELRLFSLAADIAAEYQVDEHLGYEPDKAWARQLVYDTIKRDEQLPELFSKHPGVRFLTMREAYAFVKNVENGLRGTDTQSKEACSFFENMENGLRETDTLSKEVCPFPENMENDVSAANFDEDTGTFSIQNSGEQQNYPRTLAELERLFTIGDMHPTISVNKESSIGEKPQTVLLSENRTNEIGEGLPDDSRKSKHKGLRSSGNSAKKDAVGEAGSLKKRAGHDYKSFLKQFMVSGETRTLDLDSFDPVYYTLGLDRYGNMPFVEPLETKEVLRLDELVIVIDTSGSCSGPMVRFFLEETWSVFRQQENFFDRFHVHILQCDAMVQQDTRLTTLEEAEQYMANIMIHGGGNTDFRPAFRYIKELKRKGELRRLKGIIYFTDGFGTFPKKGDAPACKTVFVSLRKQFDQVEVPVWAERLILEPPKGADWAMEYTGGFQRNIY